ncbi:MAG: YifB family Mg chelatase-like AAA ATPase [Gemmatimonadota bacterium]
MFRIVHTFALIGATPVRVRVEVTIRRGAPGIRTSGLSPSAAREAVERIRAVAAGRGLRIPGLRITVNFAPADLPKAGAHFDLPLLVGVLAGAGAIPEEPLSSTALVGELGLDGSIRPVCGVLPIALGLQNQPDLQLLVVPRANLREVAGIPDCAVVGARDVDGVLGCLSGGRTLPSPGAPPARAVQSEPELADVRGQGPAKRALEIAAAGGHNLLLTGEPGAGKSMLAARLPGILPPLDPEESLAVSSLHSVGGLLGTGSPLLHRRPFRAPHHSITMSGMIGGGSQPRPGEVSLAHCGALFLDELPLFRSSVLESLRAPIESGVVHLTTLSAERIREELVKVLDADSASGRCTCETWMVRRYTSRISGPLLDRFEIRVSLAAVPWGTSRGTPREESTTAACLNRVREARAIAAARAAEAGPAAPTPMRCNSDFPTALLRRFCRLDAAGESLLRTSVRRHGLSARGCDRILSVARTVADLDASEAVRSGHIAEGRI